MSNTDVPGISFHDFNNVEGRRLWGFLNIKEEGLFPRTPFLACNWHLSGCPDLQGKLNKVVNPRAGAPPQGSTRRFLAVKTRPTSFHPD